MMQFKEFTEKATIQVEAATINIPDVIAGQAGWREIPAKLKVLFCISEWGPSATGGSLFLYILDPHFPLLQRCIKWKEEPW